MRGIYNLGFFEGEVFIRWGFFVVRCERPSVFFGRGLYDGDFFWRALFLTV